jgi:hypothetical protein
MSLLGESFDSFLLSISGIIDFFINLILAVLTLIYSVFASLGNLVQILNYIFGFIEFFISIILNPYLLATFILGSGFYYASFTAHTRKELLMQTGIYYKYVGEAIAKIAQAVYTIVHKIIVGIIDTV